MNNKLYICTWVSDDSPETFCGYVWANHYVKDSDMNDVKFFDVHGNYICLIPDCNDVREVYNG